MYNNKIETFSNGELKGHMLYDQGNYNLSSSSSPATTIEGYTVPKANQDGSSPNLGKLNKINVFEGNRMHKVLSLDVPDYNFSNKSFATNFQYQIAKIMGGFPPTTFIENSPLSPPSEQKPDTEENNSFSSSQKDQQYVLSDIINNNDTYINNNFQQIHLKESELPATVENKSKNTNKIIEKIKQNIESLKIDFIGIDGPVKAKKQIIFEFGPSGGKCLVRYHSIIDSQNCLILVYDTRYEDGVQFLPPSTNDRPIKVYLPDENKTLNVYSLDLTFSLGSLDFIVLIKESA